MKKRAIEIKPSKLDIISSHTLPFLIAISLILTAKDLFLYGGIVAVIALILLGMLLHKYLPD